MNIYDGKTIADIVEEYLVNMKGKPFTIKEMAKELNTKYKSNITEKQFNTVISRFRFAIGYKFKAEKTMLYTYMGFTAKHDNKNL